MVSGSTWEQASSQFIGRKLADLRVVGRKTAVPVYEMAGFAQDPAPAGWTTFYAGVAHFHHGDFAGAKELFEQLPDDPAARSYARRCADLIAHPPAVWDGVWGLTEK
jgi:adenylate cyclase